MLPTHSDGGGRDRPAARSTPEKEGAAPSASQQRRQGLAPVSSTGGGRMYVGEGRGHSQHAMTEEAGDSPYEQRWRRRDCASARSTLEEEGVAPTSSAGGEWGRGVR